MYKFILYQRFVYMARFCKSLHFFGGPFVLFNSERFILAQSEKKHLQSLCAH